jgi:hypothetical protein
VIGIIAESTCYIPDDLCVPTPGGVPRYYVVKQKIGVMGRLEDRVMNGRIGLINGTRDL